ncbi:hypothetical protein [Haloarchaeobius sp. HME9146]|uniref:hypothetical protein n=1 Tax=Haloarchaeobius sp. HME9146 TaxID=2978732 RepID=UPI0021BEA6F2|nr:hypothetical protein [Haloarchaeobius sp. HME9146]MCT9097134.1 hypothetical protein [Haloarchaeobius sp. HME9146]
MNLNELRSALDTERQKGGLQQLRDSFYQEVAEYVEELKSTREEAAAEADDPFSSPEIQRLTDEIETAKNAAESLYERRLGKLVKQASLAAANMANAEQVQGLTAEERQLYDDLVSRIEENKAHMLDVVAGKAETTPAARAAEEGEDGTAGADAETDPAPAFDPDPATDPVGADEPNGSSTGESTPSDDSDVRSDPDVSAAEARAVADADPTDAASQDDGGVSAADVMGNTADTDDPAPQGAPPQEPTDPAADADSTPEATGGQDEPAAAEDVDRTEVLITRDVGDIFGVDEREYSLSADDVVELPSANADPLVERDAAKKLE